MGTASHIGKWINRQQTPILQRERVLTMKHPITGNKLSLLAVTATALLTLTVHSTSAAEKPFPKRIPALFGSLPEGFAIGNRTTAYNGSVDGSIYKMDLRSGEGELLVEPEPDFNADTDCYKLGMRVDPRTNYLFVAGCDRGNAYVFDADNGALIMEYQLPLPAQGVAAGDTLQIVNDLAITEDAVYFTDAHQPLLYRLPLTANGGLPAADAATAIVLGGDFVNIAPEEYCCGANGIVELPYGKGLIVGHSNYSQLFLVDPDTGYATLIAVDQPLSGFLDGIVSHGRTMYILTPGFNPVGDIPDDMIQVVTLNEDLISAAFVGTITDPDMDGVASGALLGKSLYVNNARYFADLVSEKWITRLNTRAVE